MGLSLKVSWPTSSFSASVACRLDSGVCFGQTRCLPVLMRPWLPPASRIGRFPLARTWSSVGGSPGEFSHQLLAVCCRLAFRSGETRRRRISDGLVRCHCLARSATDSGSFRTSSKVE
ncbi:MAG: hypothetical protein ACI8P0_003943 [Planctomycetaceae bacterium]|jgi:hypothetical protein